MTEEWRPVVGHEGFYEVSDLGRVRSLDRVIVCSGALKGTYFSKKPGRLLRPGPQSSGHLSVVLGRGNTRTVHSLVAEAFLGPRPPDMEVRHLDGDETNNRVSNIKWDTRGNNNRDKKWHRGSAGYKLSPDEILQIKRSPHLPASDLAAMYDVCDSTIYYIRSGKIHTDVIA